MSNFEIKPTSDQLELLAKQAVDGFIIGLHRSIYHGYSVEFAEHRQYNPGDNLKYIDWKVWGKSEKMFVKKFEEETNLRCYLLLDTSSSMQFPKSDSGLSKLQYSCIAAASLITLLKSQMDATALVTFHEEITRFSACKSSNVHYRALMNELAQEFDQVNDNKSSKIAQQISAIAGQIHKRALVVIFSDMVDDEATLQQLTESIKQLRHQQHEVILFQVMDKKQEIDFDFENRPLEFEDLETGEKVKINAQSQRKAYKEALTVFNDRIIDMCYANKVSRVAVDLSAPVDQLLHTFLLKRNKMK
jgi:uncharacterized protein (DUF58 family)